MITLEQAVNLVWRTFDDAQGGEVYVQKIPSMNIVDIAKAVAPEASHKLIGIRPGEKLHEQMISAEDSFSTYEYRDFYKILPNLYEWSDDPSRIINGVKVSEGFTYSSENNSSWMSVEDLKQWISHNKNIMAHVINHQ
jgi:FlaA1/EpsC-like NDP-sugar epimerase